MTTQIIRMDQKSRYRHCLKMTGALFVYTVISTEAISNITAAYNISLKD